jgi:hypothetical protein
MLDDTALRTTLNYVLELKRALRVNDLQLAWNVLRDLEMVLGRGLRGAQETKNAAG